MRQLILTFSENLFIEGREYRPLNLLGRACNHIRTYVNDAICEGYLGVNPNETRYYDSQDVRDKEFIGFYHEKTEKTVEGVKYYGLRNKNIYDNLKQK